MKTIKLLSLFFSLAVVLSACSLPGISSTPAQITNKVPFSSAATMTLNALLTQTHMAMITPIFTTSMVIASPMSTSFPTRTPRSGQPIPIPVNLLYGGGTMTMNLAWADRSNSEDGYKIYRDKQLIASLAPNSTSYVDVAYVATGEKLSYSIEAFNKDWRASGSTITHGCQ